MGGQFAEAGRLLSTLSRSTRVPFSLVFSLRGIGARNVPWEATLKRPIILICATALASAAAQNFTINVATTAPSGDKIRGPVTINVTGVNGLRQRAVLSTTVTYPAGPSLSGIPFIPPIPSSQAQSNEAPAAAEPSAAAKPVPGRPGPAAVSVQPPDIGGIFRDFVEELNKYELQRVDVQNAILAVIRQVNRAKDAAEALVATSDAALAADSTGKRLTDTAQALHGDLLSAIRAQWPDDQAGQSDQPGRDGNAMRAWHGGRAPCFRGRI